MEDNLPPGRVVRLHFSCRAEVPIGSSLRVTGSTLWAPAQLTAQDPTNAHHISMEQTSEAMPTTSVLGESPPDESEEFNFCSSVEMVTSPEDYPIWKTKRPVVVVLYKKSQIQHHYYRYMVVTPGATELEDDRGATSNEYIEISSVMAWEDPFMDHTSTSVFPTRSTGSLVSVISAGAEQRKRSLANLPYRTLDIHVDACEMTEHGMDTWNNKEDESFRSYLIREAINEENSKLNSNRMSSQGDDEEESRTPPIFSSEQRIFFICYHLPVVVVKDSLGNWRVSWSESLLAKTEGSRVVSNYNAHWVGTISASHLSEDDKTKITLILSEMNCIPLFLEEELVARHYSGFCKQVLWPAFHNIDLLDLSKEEMVGWDQSQLDSWWEAYQQVNQAFCDVMGGLVRQNDILWIHDYHLALLPQRLDHAEILKAGRSMSRKVFFLHIPFPTSQIFRELECGVAILQGMLHANVLGFHAFDHARHFLNAVKRILGLDYESMVGGLIGVHFHGKTVVVTMSNVSIEPRMVDGTFVICCIVIWIDSFTHISFYDLHDSGSHVADGPRWV
jgi:trehalose 6-phosphate synthase/phosphatase